MVGGGILRQEKINCSSDCRKDELLATLSTDTYRHILHKV
jgi:hypothetical protein